jgi:hypothetical protein
MISKVLRDLPISRNQSLKSADDYYIRILKPKFKKCKKKKIGHCDYVMEHVGFFVVKGPAADATVSPQP